jgi:hypothetical protein
MKQINGKNKLVESPSVKNLKENVDIPESQLKDYSAD